MLKKFFIILNIFILFLNSTFIVGQNTIQDTNWNKIIIYDAYFGWTHFNNELQIKKENYFLTSQQNTDSIVKKINPDVISELIQLLKQKPDTTFFKNPLQHFGKDSLWLVTHAKALWKEFSKYRKKNKEIDSFAIKTIKDVEKANTVARSLQGSRGTDDYPLLAIGIITETDTLTIHSNGQYPYMLPLMVKSEKVYNARISELISQLLPDSENTNRERIKGTDFNYYLIRAINRSYIERKSNYLEAKKKYGQSFKAIEKKFQIENVEIVDMGSIEWGNDWGKIGLEMVLKDSAFSNNIQFYTISGKSRLLHSQKKIVRKKDKLLQLLQNNPIFQYTLHCKNCLGEIHWVKNKSLSNEAIANFKEDLYEQNIPINKYNGRYKDAIFFELTEKRTSQTSFSRWIFLKDGTLILWELKGSFLMNLPEQYTLEKGFICKEINYYD